MVAVVGPVALASGRTGFLFVLEDNDLLVFSLFFNFAGNLGTFNIRLTDLYLIVRNQTYLVDNNFITRFQRVEYIRDFNLMKNGMCRFNAQPVVPGALGMWRKSAILECGGYSLSPSRYSPSSTEKSSAAASPPSVFPGASDVPA